MKNSNDTIGNRTRDLPACSAVPQPTAPNRNEYQEYFLGCKGGRCVRLTTLSPSCADCLEIWQPQPPGTLRACPGLYRDSFTTGISVLANVYFCSLRAYVSVAWSFVHVPAVAIRIMWHLIKTKKMSQVYS
jgi:hypothetical protein